MCEEKILESRGKMDPAEQILSLEHRAFNRMALFACVVVAWLFVSTPIGFPQDRSFDYFGLASPGSKIELFAPGIVSVKDLKEYSLAISPRGDEVFFSRGEDWPKTRIMHLRKIGGRWTTPKVADFSTDCYASEPSFSPDGKYLYFSSSKGMKEIKDYSIWRVTKTGSGWSDPRKVIDIEDPSIWEFHPTITPDSVYFCKWNSSKNTGSIYRAGYSGDIYSTPERVALFNVQSSDVNPFVDPHGKYLIVTSTAERGASGYDVHVFHKKENGSWADPVRYGELLNTEAGGDSYDVSPDGRFVFIYKHGDVYWTETSRIVP